MPRIVRIDDQPDLEYRVDAFVDYAGFVIGRETGFASASTTPGP